jgi:allophanate hydrolase subunit 1
MPINVHEVCRHTNRLNQNRKSSHHKIIKALNAQNNKRIIKTVRGKGQVTYRYRPVRIASDFSIETLKARRS